MTVFICRRVHVSHFSSNRHANLRNHFIQKLSNFIGYHDIDLSKAMASLESTDFCARSNTLGTGATQPCEGYRRKKTKVWLLQVVWLSDSSAWTRLR